ncbi:MAG: flagellar export protein FliJ [Candidatus Scalindua sp.]
MQKFHFRLQPLLNKERIYEDECVGRLRVIQDTFLNEKNKLENLKKSRLVSQSELNAKKKQEIIPEELRTYECFFLKLDSRINAGKSRIQAVSKELNTVQDELIKIVKKRKALEKLRDRWEEENKSYLAFMSNKEMDDIAMTKFINKLVTEND